MQTEEWKRLEREYGKYLYMPIDVPPILPNDPQRFKEWFLQTAKPIYKNKGDIASPDQTERYVLPSFLSIDSKASGSLYSVWDRNPVSDLYEQFPEIEAGLKALPFEDIQIYSLWSSQYEVTPHRDGMPLLDLPFAFRIKLYDENVVETLHLHKGLPAIQIARCEKRRLKLPEGHNVFAWNNLRLLHSSVKMQKFMKVLMIVSPSLLNKPDTKRLEDLIQRSALKYPKETWIDNEPITSYLEDHSARIAKWRARLGI